MLNQSQVNNPKQSLQKQIQNVASLIKQAIVKRNQNNKQRFLIGVCGIPGSGKTTISVQISKQFQNCVILPMDGFHICRKQLSQEGIIRRGAAFTFNLHKFQQKILQIKQSKIGSMIKYPSFDHKQKDPIENSIQILPTTQIIIVNLKLNSNQSNIWDFKIWINSQIQQSVNRVAKRHLQSGIQANYAQAYHRANTNDRSNAKYVIQNCYNSKQFNKCDNAVVIDNSINLY